MEYIAFLRQFRIGPFAIFDTVISYVGILILSPLLSRFFALFHLSISWKSWLWWMLPISVVFHLVFKQQTPLLKTLNQPEGFLIVSIILGLMVFMGAKDCHFIP